MFFGKIEPLHPPRDIDGFAQHFGRRAGRLEALAERIEECNFVALFAADALVKREDPLVVRRMRDGHFQGQLGAVEVTGGLERFGHQGAAFAHRPAAP